MSFPDDEFPRAPDAAGDFDEANDEARRLRSLLPDFVKKMAVTGLGALFMTEEGIRALAGQLKLPKEALGFVVGQAEKTKDEVTRVLIEEIRRFLQSDKLREEFFKLLAGMTVEVKAEIRLVPEKSDEPGKAPSVVVTEVNTRRGRKKKEE